MNADLQQLERLAEDAAFQKLEHYVPALRLLTALGVARDELAHSRLLATLFDPRTHRGAEGVFRDFVRLIADQEPGANVSARLRQFPAARWSRIRVQRERLRAL